jgi:hypothetical protein
VSFLINSPWLQRWLHVSVVGVEHLWLTQFFSDQLISGATVVSGNEECLSSDDGDCVDKNVLGERSSDNAVQSQSFASSTGAPELLAPSGVFESSPTSTPPDLGLPIDK